MEALPSELLIAVLTRLDSPRTAARAMQTSKFIQAADSEVVWQALVLQQWPAAATSVVAAMGLGWKARCRYYHERAIERMSLADEAQRRPRSAQPNAEQINAQFGFIFESHPEKVLARYGPRDSSFGQAAATVNATVEPLGVVSADGYNEWCLCASEEVATFGPTVEIFVLRRKDNALASFAEIHFEPSIDNDDDDYADAIVHTSWFAWPTNSFAWVPGNSYGADRITATVSEFKPDEAGECAPVIDFGCEARVHDADGSYPFFLRDLSDLLLRKVGGLQWKVLA